ncbi:hypothetical protein HDR63_03460 [bacterium]|nr:hypothetical protein [bacterium]
MEWRKVGENMSGRWIRFLGFLNAVVAFFGTLIAAGHTETAGAATCTCATRSNPWTPASTVSLTGATYTGFMPVVASGTLSNGAKYQVWGQNYTSTGSLQSQGPFAFQFMGCADGFYISNKGYGDTHHEFYALSGTGYYTSPTPPSDLFAGFCQPCYGIEYTQSSGCVCGPYSTTWSYASLVTPTGAGFRWYAATTPSYYDMRDCRARPVSSTGINLGTSQDDTGTFELAIVGECTYNN